jgi:hypothetical protein
MGISRWPKFSNHPRRALNRLVCAIGRSFALSLIVLGWRTRSKAPAPLDEAKGLGVNAPAVEVAADLPFYVEGLPLIFAESSFVRARMRSSSFVDFGETGVISCRGPRQITRK